MKKNGVFILCVMMLFNSLNVFAETRIGEYINEIREDDSFNTSMIDEEQIVFAEITSYINLAKGVKPTSFYLFMPSADGKDYYTAGFDKNKYVSTTKNFVATEPLKYFSYDKAKGYASENGLKEPDEIKAILTHGRIGLFAYEVLCDGKTYIIPYYFTDDSTYNVTNDESCELNIGTAYTLDEFVDISEREHNLYNAHMSEKNQDKDVHSSMIDNNDDVREPDIKNDDKAAEDDKKEDNYEEEEKNNTIKNDEQIRDNQISDDSKKEEQIIAKNEITDNEITKTEIDFIDVPKTHWAYNEISDLANEGIILGYGNGYFGVADSVTYEQISLLLKRQFDYIQENNECTAAKREEVIVSLVKAMNVNVADTKTEIIDKNFSDGNTVYPGNEKYIAYAIETNLVVGYDGKLNLNKGITRAETACLLHRAINIIK